MDQRFIKDRRLRKPQDITEVLKAGTRMGKDGISLTFLERKDTMGTRAGFIVRKKLGKAVSRNLMKRRMREAYRTMQLRWKPGYDLVFSANQTVDFGKVREAMAELAVRGRVGTNGAG